jgi:hypothetical protein
VGFPLLFCVGLSKNYYPKAKMALFPQGMISFTIPFGWKFQLGTGVTVKTEFRHLTNTTFSKEKYKYTFFLLIDKLLKF